jgi:hypothetical protein
MTNFVMNKIIYENWWIYYVRGQNLTVDLIYFLNNQLGVYSLIT